VRFNRFQMHLNAFQMHLNAFQVRLTSLPLHLNCNGTSMLHLMWKLLNVTLSLCHCHFLKGNG